MLIHQTRHEVQYLQEGSLRLGLRIQLAGLILFSSNQVHDVSRGVLQRDYRAKQLLARIRVPSESRRG